MNLVMSFTKSKISYSQHGKIESQELEATSGVGCGEQSTIFELQVNLLIAPVEFYQIIIKVTTMNMEILMEVVHLGEM